MVTRQMIRCNRIRWLVGAHLVLAAAPLLGMLVEINMQTLPLLWALSSLPLGGLMTLSVWVGVGRTRPLWRVAIGLAANFYLSTFSFIAHFAAVTETLSKTDWIMGYLEAVAESALLLLVLGGTFMLIGRRFELALVEPGAAPARSGHLQFSMFQILVLMSAVAIVLSLLRLARAATGHEPSTWETITIYSFMFVTFLVNVACAAFAALGTGNVKRNVVLVLAVSILLGVAAAIAMHQDMTGWWLFVGSTFIMIIPTIMVLASLLVARSCGYRLIHRTSENQTAGS
jgi:hypothetical protein